MVEMILHGTTVPSQDHPRPRRSRAIARSHARRGRSASALHPARQDRLTTAATICARHRRAARVHSGQPRSQGGDFVSQRALAIGGGRCTLRWPGRAGTPRWRTKRSAN